ncbi:MAG TPA: tyrosine-type recombinase/integrase [Myxococcota bacterium]|nr:tyrosine-type recombinase/integrase [Myxococcota bacterium]
MAACPDCEGEDFETRAVRIYDLRHGFGTARLEAGIDVKDVAILMRHSSTRVTQDIYQHVSEERKRESAERIAEALSTRA